MRKLSGLLFAAIAVFFFIVIGKGIVSLPETQQKLRDAPFINDGGLHPEWDGQLAIVSGKLRSSKNAYDDELKLTIPSPCAIRYVEMLTKGVDEDGYECLTWTPIRKNNPDEWLKEKVFAQGLHLGAYELNESLLRLLVPGKNVDRSLFDKDELTELSTHRITPIEYLGVFYLSETPSSCFKSYVYDWKYEGYRRVHYRMMDPKTDMQYCIAGRLNGSKLEKDDDLDTQPIFEGVSERKDVVRQNSLFTILGMVLVGLVCVILLFVGFARLG